MIRLPKRCGLCGKLTEKIWDANPCKNGYCCQECFVKLVIPARKSKHFLKRGRGE